jgi:hypothetical protein
LQPYIRTFDAALPLSLMECAGWLLIRSRALKVLRSYWALPTTVLPFVPSLRDRLSNRRKDLLCLVAFAALNLERCQRRDVVGPELPVVGK